MHRARAVHRAKDMVRRGDPKADVRGETTAATTVERSASSASTAFKRSTTRIWRDYAGTYRSEAKSSLGARRAPAQSISDV